MNTIRIVRDNSKDIYFYLKRINIFIGKFSKEKELLLNTLKKIKDENKNSYTLIEEVERGLHPEEQIDYIKNLMVEFNNVPTDTLIFTTNSPYVLYTINNCILAYLGENNPNYRGAKISPDEVNIFEIEEGQLVDIKNDRGVLGKNSFDATMKRVMDDFYSNLKYYS